MADVGDKPFVIMDAELAITERDRVLLLEKVKCHHILCLLAINWLEKALGPYSTPRSLCY